MTDANVQKKNLTLGEQTFQQDLGNRLRLRWSTKSDAAGLMELYGYVFRSERESPPNTFVAAWTQEMMSGEHPLITPEDFALVEDTSTNKIVAATCLLANNISYEGILLPMGRPEIVATDENYRNRGLIRKIFELIHARSTLRGHVIQGITGIRYFYRQLGYEYALDLGSMRHVQIDTIPKLKSGEAEHFVLHPMTIDDLPQVMTLYNRECAQWPISTIVDDQYWRWCALTPNPATDTKKIVYMITTLDGLKIGYVMGVNVSWGENWDLRGFAVEPNIPLTEVAPAVLRLLVPIVRVLPSREPNKKLSQITLDMGRTHNLYTALGTKLAPVPQRQYQWYMRIPDIPAFINHVAPVLQKRLASSVVAGFTGELRIDLFRNGVRILFEQGMIKDVALWKKDPWEESECSCPPSVINQLLLCHRSFTELEQIYPDAWAKNNTILQLLEALFPAHPSTMLALD